MDAGIGVAGPTASENGWTVIGVAVLCQTGPPVLQGMQFSDYLIACNYLCDYQYDYQCDYVCVYLHVKVLFPGFPTVQFLIACSMHKQGRTWYYLSNE